MYATWDIGEPAEHVWQEVQRASQKQWGLDGGYERLLERLYGGFEENPIAGLSELSDDALEALLRGEADKLGDFMAANVPLHEWVGWFEGSGFSHGLDGQVRARILRRTTEYHAEYLRSDPAASNRILVCIESHLAAWQGKAVAHTARFSLAKALHDICPVADGMELIRRWTIVTPHGDETVETLLVEALQFWPLSDALPLVRDALATGRAGAIKGIVRAVIIPNDRAAWKSRELPEVLAEPLAQSLKTTVHPSALLLALVGARQIDWLGPRVGSIADALLARTDSAPCSSFGFSYLARHDSARAGAVWEEWLFSGNPFRVEASCWAACNSGVERPSSASRALDRMLSIALDDASSGSLRAAAATALSLRGKDRAVVVLERWLTDPNLDGRRLIALGRIVLRCEDASLPILETAIDNDIFATGQRHYPLFLLSARKPLRALEICEQDLHRPLRRLNSESILLAAATAEGVWPSKAAERAAVLRARISEAEAEWMREIRLRLDAPDPRPEQRVVGFAVAATGGNQ